MASVLDSVTFDPATFRKELKEFEDLLKSKPNLSERGDVLPFFRERKHLTAYIGTLYLNIAVATELCFEFDIMGNFRADLLLGSKSANQFCVVEFEPGEEGAIFKKQNRKNPEWSARFEHAFSQIVDWFWAFEDGKKTDDFKNSFGNGEIAFASLLTRGERTHAQALPRVAEFKHYGLYVSGPWGKHTLPCCHRRMSEMARRVAGKTKKAAYQRALHIVGSVVREWDPYGLIADGAPADEFDSEIASVVAQIPRIKTENEAVLALSRVFSSAFEAERFTPEECMEAGKNLFAALSANGFVD